MQEKIDKENYERYFAEYLDGHLSSSGKAELKAFLLLWPELEEELEAMDAARLIPPVVPFEQKEQLRAFAWEAEMPLLRPDISLRFEKKKQLYRKRPVLFRVLLPVVAGVSGVAAVGLIFLTTGLFSGDRSNVSEQLPLLSSGEERVRPVQPAQTLESGLLFPGRLPATLSLRELPVRRVDAPLERSGRLYAALQEKGSGSPAFTLVLFRSEQELVLSETAKEWRYSSEGFYSRNLFSSVVDAGKQLAAHSRELLK